MIVFIINVCGVALKKRKSHTPIAAYLNSPRSLPTPGKRVQHEAGKAHIFRDNRHIQAAQDKLKPFGVLCLDARLSAREEEAFKALVFKGRITRSVWRGAPRVTRRPEFELRG